VLHANTPVKAKAPANSTSHSANTPPWISRLATGVGGGERRGEFASKAAASDWLCLDWLEIG
jgi:hypothetical protein